MIKFIELSENGDARVLAESDDFKILAATLGEVLFGIRVQNFENKLGTTKDNYRTIFGKLTYAEKHPLKFIRNGFNDGFTLSMKELDIIKKSFLIVMEDFVEDEYHTRMGFDFDLVLRAFQQIVILTSAFARTTRESQKNRTL